MSITSGTLACHKWVAGMRQIATLLTVWFVVTFVIVFFTRNLSMHLLDSDWTFTYWIGA